MEYSIGLLVLVFVIAALIIGAVTMVLAKKVKLPYTIALLIIGLGLGGIERTGFFEENMLIISDTINLLSHIDPHLILFVFLPTLIFESAFALEVHLFKRMFSQIATLAVPGLILSTVLTAVMVKFLFPWDWGWPLAFMFGALISATDPVAVVALLKEVSSRKRLETLIEGESLLNDGTAIVIFTLFYTMVLSATATSFSLPNVVGDFTFVVMLGLAIGVIFGYLAILFISKVFNNPLVEISLSIGVAYLVFFIAEHTFHVSGVVALVAMALMFASIGRTKISPEVEGFLRHFWEMMAHIANTLIFLLVGVLIATRIKLDEPDYWITLGILYVGITIIRAISVTTFIPVLKRIGTGFTKEKAIVLVWGGLRGAVSLALALTVAHSDAIPKEIGDQILFLTAGIVVLTILINGLTMKKLLSVLGLDTLPPAKEATVQKAKASVYTEIQKYLPILKQSEFLQSVEWDKLSSIKQLNAHSKYVDEDNCKNISYEDLSVAFRRRLLESERKFYWSEFKKGSLSGEATNHLSKAIEQSLDENPTITSRATLEKLWHIPNYLHKLENIPLLHGIVLRLSFARLALGYEVARGFIDAQDEVLSHIDTIAPSQEEKEAVTKEVLSNKQMTFKYMANMNSAFPEVVCTMQAATANRLLLNRERTVIEKLLKNGILDRPEANKMIEDVETRMYELLKIPTKITPPDLDSLIKNNHITDGLKKESIEKLILLFEHKIYSDNEIILKQNDQGFGLIIIARGSVEVIDENKNIVEDVLGVGSVLGISSIISGVNDKTIKSSMPVDIVFIETNSLRRVMADDPALMKNIIKYMA
ncbi:MAG: cation:proton antiporter [Campylobacterota bacterium]|nr:cation:proton antiporter [Campylobacterota bacterium]